jgi:hypothetical protein
LKILHLFLVLFLLTACGSDYGHEVRGGDLTVYFIDKKDQGIAEGIARFWKANGLTTGRKQDLQLSKVEEWYALKVIASEPKSAKSMDFNERKALLDLQSQLQSELKIENLQIVICNAKFEEVYNINE